ncbi:hybrid sensor histidine kinase/response regulator transcription factor [Marinoscillum sp. 108]|uniref:hybrid sensor histidine kinase/response regulator transcription factor n=1 Tax=Marinoscillum sp. 108 TaxID=2653151 RepID=UPI001358CDED|nr:hybrid sensor histidine kinase/response regulator transcription factor [Marinoscillum sp. 108]
MQIIAFSAFSITSGQTYKFDHLALEDGFTTAFVDAIAQDADGFIWLNTWEGLFRYDGYVFKHYKYLAKDSTIINSTALHLDSKGNFWVGTHTEGLLLYNKEHDSFDYADLKPEDLTSLRSHTISAILEDHLGNLWIGTNGNGLKVRRNGKENFEHIPFNDQGNPRSVRGEKVRIIYEDSKGRIWVGTGNYFESMISGGLNRYDHSTQTFHHYTYQPPQFKGIKPNRVQSIAEDSNNNIWIGTAPDGLYTYNDEKDQLVEFKYDLSPDKLDVMANKTISFIHEHRETNTLWVGMFGAGILTIDLKSSKATHHLLNQNDRFSLSHNSVWCIMEDRQGLLWVGTVNGLNKVNPKLKLFPKFSTLESGTFSRIADVVLSIYEDSNKTLWIGTRDGLTRSRNSDNNFQRFREDSSNPNSIKGNSIRGITEDDLGSLWIGTNKGLHKFIPESESFNHYPSSDQNPLLPKGENIFDLMTDSKGNLWIGAQMALNKYNPYTGIFNKYYYPDSVVCDCGGTLYEDQGGNIWIANDNTEVMKFDESTRKFTHIFDREVMIYQFLEDSKNRFWICSNTDGLGLYNRATGDTKFYGVLDGLPGKTITGVEEDDRGYLWVSTNNGIALFDPERNLFKSFTPASGLPVSSPKNPYKNKDGELFFGDVSGFTRFDPDSYDFDTTASDVVLTQLKIFNQIVRPSPESVINQSISVTEEVRLAHDQNDLTFDFVGLHFVAPKQNRYKVKLQNYDKDWVDLGNQHSTRYTNLSPGVYEFKVIGANSDGIWNGKASSLHIIIAPPWWKTWWAYLLYGTILICLIYLWRVYDLRRIHLKNQLELKSMEAEKLATIDQMKSRFFANISHEFRTPLTLILGPLKDLIYASKNTSELDQYHLIKRNADRLNVLINQLLDLSKLEAGSVKLEVEQMDLHAFLRPLFASFSSLAQSKHITFRSIVPEESFEMLFDADKLEKIISNLLFNAFKFTPEGGEVSVSITKDTKRSVKSRGGEKEYIEIVVKDTGQGIPGDQLETIFDRFYQVDDSHKRAFEGTGIGLALTKELVDLHHGKIAVKSKPGVGSSFTVRLPISLAPLDQGEKAKIPSTRDHPPKIVYQAEEHEVEQEIELHDNENIILIVEDNQDLMKYIKHHFENNERINHPRILEAANGLEGLTMAIEAVPDIIISDLMMPEMDGLELCHQLKNNEKTSHIPVIILTAKADQQSKLEGLEIGADDYIAKPFEAEELILKVANRIEQLVHLKKRFSQFIELGPKKISIKSIDQRFLEKVQLIIDEHLTESEFDVNSFGQELGMSRSQFYRKLKGLVGQSPNELIRNSKLIRASQLIEQNFGTVAEVAYAVGFNNLSYFTKCFKEKFQKLPSEYTK